MDIKGKTAIVTGAASGIGRATAVALAERGAAAIALVDVNEIDLRETAGRVEAAGARATVHRLDRPTSPRPKPGSRRMATSTFSTTMPGSYRDCRNFPTSTRRASAGSSTSM